MIQDTMLWIVQNERSDVRLLMSAFVADRRDFGRKTVQKNKELTKTPVTSHASNAEKKAIGIKIVRKTNHSKSNLKSKNLHLKRSQAQVEEQEKGIG